MRRVSYSQKQCGDILLVYNHRQAISELIREAEKDLVPGLDFYPSHVAIVEGVTGNVVEAWLDWRENSCAAVNPISKYDSPFIQKEVWRPEGNPFQKYEALEYVKENYGKLPYGLLDLFGFGIEALLRKIGLRQAKNPIEVSYVCSEIGLLYLRRLNDIIPCIAYGPLYWTHTDEAVRNVSPADLRKLFLRHEDKPEQPTPAKAAA